MSTRAETLFANLQSLEAITNLIGTAEDADFDCKVWQGGDASRGSITKAACAFANGTGGVIIIGVDAPSPGKGPDVVKALCPVANMQAVKGTALDFILKGTDPGIQGIQTALVSDGGGGASGFVLICIPESEGAPQRSRIDWRFPVRIASGTVPMEMFQIADRFGRRPQPDLSLRITESGIARRYGYLDGRPQRKFHVEIANNGRGLARFPALFLQKSSLQLSPFEGQPIWQTSAIDPLWTSYRGGSNDVIYQGESRPVLALFQDSQPEGAGIHELGALNLVARVVCMDMGEKHFTFSFPSESTAL